MGSKTLLILQSVVALFWGAFIVSILVGLALTFPTFKEVFSNTSYSAILEEVLKYAVVLFLISQIRLKPGSVPFIGIGFGLLEALARLQSPGYAYIKPFWAHIVFGLVMALFVYLASKTERPFVRFLYYGFALVVPVSLHILYNLVVLK